MKKTMKKILALLCAIILPIILIAPAFAAELDMSGVAAKLNKNSSEKNFTDEEIVSLFNYLNTSGVAVDNSEVVKWVRVSKKVNAEALSIALHEEIHVFTYGADNCQRKYKKSEVDINRMRDTYYMIDGEKRVVKAVPMYLKTSKTLKDPDSYTVINEYLTDNDMLANIYGLNGLLSEYYAYVKELGFLIRYRNFCNEYDVEDTASDRIAELILACDEWKRAANEYVDFIKVNFDGYVYKELTDTNTLSVLDSVNKEYETVRADAMMSAPEISDEVEAAQTNNANNANNESASEEKTFTSFWDVIEDFFETIFSEFAFWLTNLFA